MKVTRKKFISVWQKSGSIDKVAKELKLDRSYVQVKASILRNRYGIALKMFQRGRKYGRY